MLCSEMRLTPLISLYDANAVPPALSQNQIALPCIQSSAFGDGSHPTTRLCAGVLDHYCRLTRLKSVLDVGTGTGVLARIARARGIQTVIATDIDPLALASAKANAALDTIEIEIQLSDQLPNRWGPTFDLVVANILEGPLRSLAPNLSEALSPQGTLLLSGFTPLQIPALETVFSQHGLILETKTSLEGWALLAFKKTSN